MISGTVKALITGSAGFIGSNLARRLSARGDEVVGIDRRRSNGSTGLHISLDLAERTNLPEIARWTAWADVVFHLAARPGIRSNLPSIDHARHRDIVVATEHVMAVTPERTHLILTSSSSVYGDASSRRGKSYRPSRETDRLRPVSRYGHYKAEMEHLSRQYRRFEAGLAIARPFTVIGQGQRPDMALSIWTDAVLRGTSVKVFGSLDRARDVTGVERVVEGLVAMADLRYCGFMNLGSGTPRSLGEMVDAVFRATGREVPVEVLAPSPEEVRITCADPTRAVQELGIDLTTDLGRAARCQAGAYFVKPVAALSN